MLRARVCARLDSSDAVLRVRRYVFVDAGFPDAVGDDEGDGTGDDWQFVEVQVVDSFNFAWLSKLGSFCHYGIIIF